MGLGLEVLKNYSQFDYNIKSGGLVIQQLLPLRGVINQMRPQKDGCQIRGEHGPMITSLFVTVELMRDHQ